MFFHNSIEHTIKSLSQLDFSVDPHPYKHKHGNINQRRHKAEGHSPRTDRQRQIAEEGGQPIVCQRDIFQFQKRICKRQHDIDQHGSYDGGGNGGTVFPKNRTDGKEHCNICHCHNILHPEDCKKSETIRLSDAEVQAAGNQRGKLGNQEHHACGKPHGHKLCRIYAPAGIPA